MVSYVIDMQTHETFVIAIAFIVGEGSPLPRCRTAICSIHLNGRGNPAPTMCLASYNSVGRSCRGQKRIDIILIDRNANEPRLRRSLPRHPKNQISTLHGPQSPSCGWARFQPPHIGENVRKGGTILQTHYKTLQNIEIHIIRCYDIKYRIGRAALVAAVL